MLTVKDLAKQYGDVAALGGISFHISPGETTGIFGLEGAGKTTLLDILSGYLLNYTGNAECDGADLRRQPMAYRAKIAYIPQNCTPYPDMTVREYGCFLAGLHGLGSGKKARHRVEESLQFVGILPLAEYSLQTLGAQDCARAALAAALAPEPEVLFIDEPFAGLRMDEIVGQQALLRAVAQRTTLVVASRSIFGFSELCKRTIVLNKGRIANESGSNLFARTDAKARVRLRVACAPAKAKAAFQFIPGILNIDFRSAPEKGVWDILIDSDGQEDIRAQVWFAAAAAQVPVLEMRYLHISPEDIFLQLTGQNQGEGV